MNFLAHSHFGRQNPDWIAGQFCGDFFRGSRLEDFSPAMQSGILMHRKIDAYTDRHPVNLEARRLFEKPFRRYAGVLTDVVYDHYLARDWARYSEISLDAHVEQVHQALELKFEELPVSLQRFARHLIDTDMLRSYRQFDACELALQRIASRSERLSPLADAGTVLKSLDAPLSDCFGRFYPDLNQHVSTLTNNSQE